METDHPSRRRAALAAVALMATLVPVAGASAATLHLKAPREIDRAEKFRVVAFGKAKPLKDYSLSVLYHDDNQGRCAPTVEKEVTRNQHFEVFYMRRVATDADGRFEVRSRKIVGGEKKASGKLCGYLTNSAGENKDTVVRRIEFT
jgi:5-hydroxyisourate hydrolase-like protein (transthyretin family)